MCGIYCDGGGVCVWYIIVLLFWCVLMPLDLLLHSCRQIRLSKSVLTGRI